MINPLMLYHKVWKLYREWGLPFPDNERSWNQSIGFFSTIPWYSKDNQQEIIRRIIVFCNQQFNFQEKPFGLIKNLSAEAVSIWIYGGYDRFRLGKDFNLSDSRLKLYDKCLKFLDSQRQPLVIAVKQKKFWSDLHKVYGSDPVKKRVNLARMMLKSMEADIWKPDRVNVLIDYNILAVFKYFKIINYKGNFQDKKSTVNKFRKLAYKYIEQIVKETTKTDDYVDKLFFLLGRELRRRQLVNVCLYPGCTDY